MVYRSLLLPIISSTNLQKTWTDKNNLDMFVKSDQEITDEQVVHRPCHLGWEDLHTRRKHGKMVFIYRIVNHLIEIPACTILQSVGASRTRGHNHRYLVPYWSVDAYKSRKENPQKPTQLSSRSHPRHLVGKRTAQKTPS